MKLRTLLVWPLAVLLIASGASAAVLTRSYWYPRLFPAQQTAEANHDDHHDKDRIELTEQARKNIKLDLREVELQSHQRTLRLPGMIVPRPGKTTIKVSMPIISIVKAIHAFPGQTVKPGDPLFTVHLHDHDIHKTQTDLYKTVQDLKINEEEQARMRKAASQGAIPQVKLLELEYQQRRLFVAVEALEKNLRIHHFSFDQIQEIKRGKLIDDWIIRVPLLGKEDGAMGRSGNGEPPSPSLGDGQGSSLAPVYEVGRLQVQIGDQVEPGKALCELANHHLLFVEAQVFQQELPVVQQAIKESQQVKADILDVSGKDWQKTKEPLHILYVDQHIDSASQTASVYLELTNEIIHDYEDHHDKATYILWKYRPGQRVYVSIPTQTYDNVFVLPTEAVVWEGPNAYVFRENGNVLERQAVHVKFQDQRQVVIAHDGSILPGNVIAHNGAAQIQRALTAQGQDDDGHHHHHH